jgi:hypothetical protein
MGYIRDEYLRKASQELLLPPPPQNTHTHTHTNTSHVTHLCSVQRALRKQAGKTAHRMISVHSIFRLNRAQKSSSDEINFRF